MGTIALLRPTPVTRRRFWGLVPVGARTLVFPAGRYELQPGVGQIRWRYLGPHFSTHGTYEQRGNTSVPIGFVGPWEFAGQWVGDGVAIHPQAVEIARRDYYRFMHLVSVDRMTQALAMLVEMD